MIEPVVEQLSSQSWFSVAKNQRSEEIERRLARGLGHASLDLRAILAETTITLRDLAYMAPGDVIVTETEATRPAVLWVGHERKFTAEVGQYRGSRALRVVRAISRDDRV
ncbi:MAG: hypothetical protein DWB46_06405 [Leptolyngbya sp.]|nr:hypothetical protein [Leptolyngbya sp.]